LFNDLVISQVQEYLQMCIGLSGQLSETENPNYTQTKPKILLGFLNDKNHTSNILLLQSATLLSPHINIRTCLDILLVWKC